MNMKHLGFALMLAVAPVLAQAAPANMLIYISPQEYTHSVKLWQYYYDYWFEQGPAVEPLAKAMLSEEFGDVSMCTAGSDGKSLVWIKPRMYYNPQMKTFYGEITANTFTSNGEPLAEYIGESRKHGFLDILPRQQVESVYRMAMHDLVVKMREDQHLKSIAADGANNADAATACATVAALPPPGAIDMNYFFKRVN
jgi:hypothetical protein